LPAFQDYGELNAYLLDCSEQDAKRRWRFGRMVRELWQEERARLRPLPQRLPEACTTVLARVNRRQQVRLDGNWYSVPPEYVGRQVTVHACAFRLTIAWQDKVIASHTRSYGLEQEVLEPHHYLPVLLRKPGAFARATPMLKWPLPPVYETYHRRLRERQEGGGGTREYIRVLMLLKDYALHEVTGAVEHRPPVPVSTATRRSGPSSGKNRSGNSAKSPWCGPTGWSTSTSWYASREPHYGKGHAP
jgi:hypothetical protein